MDDVTVEFEGNALRAVARQALAKGMGARGLRAIMVGQLAFSLYSHVHVRLGFLASGWCAHRHLPGVAGARLAGAHVQCPWIGHWSRRRR